MKVSAARRIRVGVTLDGRRVARWKRDVLAGLREVEGAELALVVLAPAARSRRRSLADLLLRLYSALDRRIFALEPDPLEKVDVSSLIAGVMTVERRTGGGAGAVAVDVDVAITLGAEADVLLDDAPLGVWTYRHGLGRERADDVPYLRDVKERRLASHVALVRQSDQVVLAHSTIRTDLVSMQRVRSAALLRCRHLAGRLLRDLRRRSRARRAVGGAGDRGPARELGVAEVLSSVGRIPARLLLRRLFNTLWHEQWLLVVRPVEDGSPPISFVGARLHRPPRGRDWADPFPIRVNGRSWLFFEEIPWRGGRGHISVAELDEAGDLHDRRVALETPHHLSYPFVFEHDDDTLSAAGVARLVRHDAVSRPRFPDDWEPLCVLADDALYDPTLLPPATEPGGCSARSPTWASPRTTSCTSSTPTTLEGPWHPHPRNPVVSDVRGARPAGPLIRDGSRLLRPAQDCSGRYGRAVVFKEVLELSRSAYREVEVARLEPDWLVDNLATHHYATGERWTATDAMLPPATLVSAERPRRTPYAGASGRVSASAG